MSATMRAPSPGMGRPYARVAWLGSGSTTPRVQYVPTPRASTAATTLMGSAVSIDNSVGAAAGGMVPVGMERYQALVQSLQASIGRPREPPVTITTSTSIKTTHSVPTHVPAIATARVGRTMPPGAQSSVADQQSSSTVTPVLPNSARGVSLSVGARTLAGSALSARTPSQVVRGAAAALQANSVVTTVVKNGGQSLTTTARSRSRSHSMSVDRFASTNLENSWITPSYRNIGVPGFAAQAAASSVRALSRGVSPGPFERISTTTIRKAVVSSSGQNTAPSSTVVSKTTGVTVISPSSATSAAAHVGSKTDGTTSSKTTVLNGREVIVQPRPTSSTSASVSSIPEQNGGTMMSSAAPAAAPSTGSNLGVAEKQLAPGESIASAGTQYATRAYHSMKLASSDFPLVHQDNLLDSTAAGSSVYNSKNTTSSLGSKKSTVLDDVDVGLGNADKMSTPPVNSNTNHDGYCSSTSGILAQKRRVSSEQSGKQRFTSVTVGESPISPGFETYDKDTSTYNGNNSSMLNITDNMLLEAQHKSGQHYVPEKVQAIENKIKQTSPPHTYSPGADASSTLLAEIDMLRRELMKEQSARRDIEDSMRRLEGQVSSMAAELVEKDAFLQRKDTELFEAMDEIALLRQQATDAKEAQTEILNSQAGVASGAKSVEETSAKETKPNSPASARGAAHTHQFTDEADLEIQRYVKRHPDFPYAIEKVGRDHYVFGKEKKEVIKNRGKLLVRVGGGTESLLEYMENLHRKGMSRGAC
ncbi:unnamed protein product [Amoebophrya sp. A25]|nr:unnamed protein product [Amoebophrya sp. A25]|eukprot:GSA25T00004426001.1